MQYVLCYGAWSGGADGNSANKVELVAILADDKVVACLSGRNPGQLEPLVIWIDQPKLFGGDKQEGGLSGTIRFYEGTDDRAMLCDVQPADTYLAACEAREAPAYRGVCHAILGDHGHPFYVGTTAYVKTIGFIVKRCPNPFGYSTTGGLPKTKTPIATYPGVIAGSGSYLERTTHTLFWIESIDDDGTTLTFTVSRLSIVSGERTDVSVKVAKLYVGSGAPGIVVAGPDFFCVYHCAGPGGADIAWFSWSGEYLGNAGGTSIDYHWGSEITLWGTAIVKSGRTLIVSDARGTLYECSPTLGLDSTISKIGDAYYNGGWSQVCIPVLDASGNVWAFSQQPSTAAHNYVSTGTEDFALVDESDQPSAAGLGQWGIYVSGDNSIIWATSTGLYKWDIATKKVIASLATPASGPSQWIGSEGYILNGAQKIDPVSMTPITDWTLADFSLPSPPATQRLHQYSAEANAMFLFDQAGNLQEFSLASTASGIHDIDGDANPALAIYDLLTHPVYGLRKRDSIIDLASFDYAARVLFAEGLGISMNIDTPTDADSLIGDILRHIDGVLYNDPQTGLYTLKLARADYDPATLPELSVDDILEAPDYSRGSWSETTNEVKVTFTDRSQNYQQNVSAPAQDTANIAIVGTLNSETVDFKGISNAKTAALVAARALKTLSYPLAKLTIKANRRAWKLRPGGCFRFTWTPFGIEDQVFRVARIGYGKVDDGTITIDAVEDIFGLSIVAFTPPSGSGWIDPVAGKPAAPIAQLAIESPYQMLPTTTAEEKVLAGAVRGDAVTTGFEVWTDEGGSFAEVNVGNYCLPSGKLAADYSRKTSATDAAGFSLTDGVDLAEITGTNPAGRTRGDCLLLFADTGELCAFGTATANPDGSYTLAPIVRGVYDTLPADHPAGTRVFIIRDAGTTLLVDCDPNTILDTSGSGDDFVVTED